MRWTDEQDEVLYTYGSLGVAECRRILADEFGIDRSEEAIRRHAYRIGASVIEYETCIGCGLRVRSVNREGLCRACNLRRLVDTNREYNERLKRELRENEKQEESDEYRHAKRDYNAVKQQNSRLRKRIGRCGD